MNVDTDMENTRYSRVGLVATISLLFALLLTIPNVTVRAATNTGWVGGNGGKDTQSVYCPKDYFVTYMKYRKGPGIAIGPLELLGLICRNIKDQEKYRSTKAVGNSTSVGHLQANPVAGSLGCKENEWVSGIASDTSNILGIKVVKNLTVACKKMVGGSYTRMPIAEDVSNGSIKSCPAGKIGIGMTVKSGLYIDRLRLICEDPEFHSVLPPAPKLSTIPQDKPSLLKPVVGSHASKQDVPVGNWAFTWNGVRLATKYQLCAKPKGAPSGNCWHNKYHSGSGTGRVTKTVNTPQNQVGKASEWLVRGCNNDNECGPWSSRETFLVVPDVVKGLKPQNNAVSTSRNVEFSWNPVHGASSYRLVIFPKPGNSPFKPYYPELSVPNMLNISVNGTGKTVNIPTNLGDDLEWAVVACVDISGHGLRCSIGYSDHDLRILVGANKQPTVKNSSSKSRIKNRK